MWERENGNFGKTRWNIRGGRGGGQERRQKERKARSAYSREKLNPTGNIIGIL